MRMHVAIVRLEALALCNDVADIWNYNVQPFLVSFSEKGSHCIDGTPTASEKMA